MPNSQTDREENAALKRQVIELQKGLDDTRAKLDAIVNSGMLGVIYWNRVGEIHDANDTVLDALGYTRAELEAGGVNWKELTPPEYAQADNRAMDEISKRGLCTPFAKEYFKKDGSRLPILLGAAGLEGSDESGVAFMIDITAQAETERQLKEAQRFNDHVMAAVPGIIYVFDLKLNRNGYSNRNLFDMLGYTPEELVELGDRFFEVLFHPDDAQLTKDLVARWDDTPDDVVLDVEYRMKAKTGEYRWFHLRDKVFRRDESGKVTEVIGTAYDITRRKRVEQERQTLEQELNHRVANNFSTILGVLRMTLDANRDPVEFAEVFEARVKAMAHVQALLARESWEAVDLHELVKGMVQPYAGLAEVKVDGPRQLLAAEIARPAAMALHELAVNATKYGALSVPAGRLHIRWIQNPDRSLTLDWTEHADTVPSELEPGQGMQIVTSLLEYEVGGTADFSLVDGMLVWRLTLPARPTEDRRRAS